MTELEPTAIERLEQQKLSLEAHLWNLENELLETGRHLAAVQEHIYRLKNTGYRISRRPKLPKLR